MTTKRDKEVAEIARHMFGRETLESRGSDRLDFFEVSVWRIKSALDLAYDAGKRDGTAEAMEAKNENPV